MKFRENYYMAFAKACESIIYLDFYQKYSLAFSTPAFNWTQAFIL